MPTNSSIIDRLLAPGGPVARAMQSVTGAAYEVRPAQAQMCEAVALTMQNRSHLLAEAGTGTGKSFAYLLPAALRCVLYGETVVVSTHTISLQEQILQKDLPVIERVLSLLKEAGELPQAATDDGEHRALKGVLVKGRGNYVSVRRLRLASERQEKLFSDAAARRSLHVIEDWALGTQDGTISSLPPLERWGVWDKVQSDSGNCMGKKCPTYDKCFYQAARAEMDGANLLICNHALFFSDLALRVQDAGFLPAYQHVIFDEAHTVEEVAGEHFGTSLSEGRVQHLLSSLYQPRTGKGYLAQLAVQGDDMQAVEKAIALSIRAADSARGFFEDLDALAKRSGGDAEARARKPWTQQHPGSAEARSEPRIVRCREPNMVENALTPVMRELSLRLRSLRDIALHEPDRYELNAFALRAEMIAGDATTLVQQTSPHSAYWIEVTGDDGGALGSSKRVNFACAPIEIAPILKERLFVTNLSVTLTSATLALAGAGAGAGATRESRQRSGAQERERVGEAAPDAGRGDADTAHVEPGVWASSLDGASDHDGTVPRRIRGIKADRASVAFAHTAKQLGCDGAACLQVASPFDYASQVELYVERVEVKPRALPDSDFVFSGEQAPAFVTGPKRATTPPYAHALARHVLKHVRATDGGAFVLFTSFATLHQVARELESELSILGLPMLVQGRDGSRTAILQRFRENHRSVLLGAASFWQGVDVRGQGLRNVIITKLPFDPPDRPLVQARGELIQSRGGNPFMEDALPRAVLRLKQGFGRLIRSKDDHGRVVILDDRVLTTRYGKAFLEALPAGMRVRGWAADAS